MKIISLLIIAFCISPAHAKIYKCVVNKQTRFQEVPCPKNSNSSGEIEVKPNIISTQGLREYIKQDKIPKKIREQKERNTRRAKQTWMSGEVEAFAKRQKRLLKLKKLELKQREEEKKARRQKNID